jgi:hypothetical protein
VARADKREASEAKTNGATLGFEQKLWQAADKLRNNMDLLPFAMFFADLGIDIDTDFPEGSKANRLRAFLRGADPARAAQVLEAMLARRGTRAGDDALPQLAKVKHLIFGNNSFQNGNSSLGGWARAGHVGSPANYSTPSNSSSRRS